MQKLRSCLCVIDSISEWSGKIVSYLIFLVVFCIIYEVIARAAFNAATRWSNETSAFIFGGYALLGGAHVLLLRGHVNVDILCSRLPLRTRAIVDLVTSIFFFVFVISLLWWGSALAWNSLMIQETSNTPWSPLLYPFKMMIPLGAFLLLLQGTAKFIRDLITAVTGGMP